MSEDSLSSKFAVNFTPPKHGWLYLQVEYGSSNLDVDFSDVFSDSMLHLIEAIEGICKGRRDELKVTFHCEPTTFEFCFNNQDDDVILLVNKFPDLPKQIGMGSNGKLVFEARGNRERICLTFWRSIRKFQSQISLEQYAQHWKHPFPVEQVDSLTKLIKGKA
jgi:hypothetical protein